MNAHNEQHDPASAVVKQNLATHPAAAQEAVGWQWRWLDTDNTWSEWVDGGSRKEIDARIARWKADGEDHRMQVRPLFAAPVAAAPVVYVDSDAFDYLVDEVAAEHGEMLDDGGPSGWSFTCEGLAAFAKHLMSDYKGMLVADAYAIARAEAKRDSTPAAPGIDMGVPGATLTIDGKTFTVDEVRAALLIDASPKDELESWKRGTKACAEVLGQVMRQTQDSPKGGSEACERIAAMLHQEATGEPWTVAGVEHDGPDRAYYRELARRVLDAALVSGEAHHG